MVVDRRSGASAGVYAAIIRSKDNPWISCSKGRIGQPLSRRAAARALPSSFESATTSTYLAKRWSPGRSMAAAEYSSAAALWNISGVSASSPAASARRGGKQSPPRVTTIAGEDTQGCPSGVSTATITFSRNVDRGELVGRERNAFWPHRGHGTSVPRASALAVTRRPQCEHLKSIIPMVDPNDTAVGERRGRGSAATDHSVRLQRPLGSYTWTPSSKRHARASLRIPASRCRRNLRTASISSAAATTDSTCIARRT